MACVVRFLSLRLSEPEDIMLWQRGKPYSQDLRNGFLPRPMTARRWGGLRRCCASACPMSPRGIITLTFAEQHKVQQAIANVSYAMFRAHVSYCQTLKASDRIVR